MRKVHLLKFPPRKLKAASFISNLFKYSQEWQESFFIAMHIRTTTNIQHSASCQSLIDQSHNFHCTFRWHSKPFGTVSSWAPVFSRRFISCHRPIHLLSLSPINLDHNAFNLLYFLSLVSRANTCQRRSIFHTIFAWCTKYPDHFKFHHLFHL